MRANESGPTGTASEADGPSLILSSNPVEWYEAGVLHGIEIGRQQVEDEWRGRQAVSAAIARQIASWGPYDELAERRGDHDRAVAHRELLRERGVLA